MTEIETYKDWHETSTCFTVKFTRIADLKALVNFVQNYSENIQAISQQKLKYDAKSLSSYYEMDLSAPVLIVTETVNVRIELMEFCQSRRIPVKLRNKIGSYIPKEAKEKKNVKGDKKNAQCDGNQNNEHKKEKSTINNQVTKNKYYPLTEDELHRLFRNEYLTIDDPRYFR